MTTLGTTLQTHREKMGVTASEAAAATHIKVQHIEALERNDFSRMTAPIYAKGFIRLYAEFLGLDPEPLIREYVELHAPRERPPIIQEEPSQPQGDGGAGAAKPKKLNWLAAYQIQGKLVTTWAWLKQRAVMVGSAVGALVLVVVLSKCGLDRQAEREARPVIEMENRPVGALLREPPEPYLNVDLNER